MPIRKALDEDEFHMLFILRNAPYVNRPSYFPTVVSNIQLSFSTSYHQWNPAWSYAPGRKGQQPSTEVEEAFLAYAKYGLYDPTLNIPEAGVYKLRFGLPFGVAWGMASLRGIVLTGIILTIVDPGHKWEGGFDETEWYQSQSKESRLRDWTMVLTQTGEKYERFLGTGSTV